MARKCIGCDRFIADWEAVCPFCGANNSLQTPQQTEQQPTYQQPTYQQPTYQQPAYQQPAYQQPTYQQPTYQQPTYQQPTYQQPTYQQPTYQQPTTPLNQTPDMPMKWFKFVIWVQLFLSALANLATGIQALTGAQYQGQAESVYRVFPDLQGADTFYGIVLILLAVFAIVVRFRLAGYRKDGPTMYLGMLAANIVVPLIYAFMATSAMSGFGVDTSDIWSNNIGSIIVAVVLLICNAIYFNKRKHLFDK